MHTTADTDLDEGSRDITNLFEIYGAIDQHLEFRPQSEETGQVALLLPVYRRADAYWFQSFLASTGVIELWDLDDPLTRVQSACAALAESKPRCRNRARRLFGVSVAAHAFPELTDRELADAALGTRQLEEGGGDIDARARELATRLRSNPETDTPAGRDAWWDLLLSAVPDPGGVGPRPCSGRLSWVTHGGDRDLVATLRTECDAFIAFDAARQFCDDPELWECFPSWCDMDYVRTENGFKRYREVVSFNCDKDEFPKLTVDLYFSTEFDEDPQKVVTTEYWLSPDQPEDRVLTNQGYLRIVELTPPPDPSVRVTTTKTIQFSPDLGGPGLAIVACQLGYLEMVEDLVCCASRPKGQQGYPDVSFRAQRTPPDGTTAAYRPGTDYGWLIKTMVDEAGAAAEDLIDENLKAARRSAAKLEAGYKADDLVQDLADWYVRMLHGAARFADIGLRVVQTAPQAEEKPPARPATHTQQEL